jgi:hypothetical protein
VLPHFHSAGRRDIVEHIERGLRALEIAPALHRARRAELLILLSEACKSVGDYVGTRDAARRAADEARAVDSVLFASAAICHADWYKLGEADVTSVDLLREALVLLDASPSRARAEVLATLAATLSLQGDPTSGGPLAEEAVRIARALHDPVTLWGAIAGRIITLWGDEDVTQRFALSDELARLGKSAEDPSLYLPGQENQQYARAELGDLSGFRTYLNGFSEDIERLRQGTLVLKRTSQLAPRGWAAWELPLLHVK